MKFICATCGNEQLHFRGLIDHYKDEHPELLRRYEIKHKPSRVTALISSPNAEIVLEVEEWRKEDCRIKEIK